MHFSDNYANYGARRVFLLVVLLLIFLLAIALCFALWPGLSKNKNEMEWLNSEARLLVVVCLGSCLGSSLSAINNFLVNLNIAKHQINWFASYISRILLGVPLGLLSYFTIRGVILEPNAPPEALNRVGLAFLTTLIGLFESFLIGRLSVIFQAAYGNETTLEKKIEQISNVLGTTLLTNYEGYLCLTVTELETSLELKYSGNELPLESGKTYQLHLQFDPWLLEGNRIEPIRISNGVDEVRIEFSIAINTRFIKAKPREQKVTFNINERSPTLLFTLEKLPGEEDQEFWIEVSQKNRIVAIIPSTTQKIQSSTIKNS